MTNDEKLRHIHATGEGARYFIAGIMACIACLSLESIGIPVVMSVFLAASCTAATGWIVRFSEERERDSIDAD